jgi:hypothetical protein
MNKYGHVHKCSNINNNINLSKSVNFNNAYEKKESHSFSRSLGKKKDLNGCSPVGNLLRKSNYFSSMKDISNGINLENKDKLNNQSNFNLT